MHAFGHHAETPVVLRPVVVPPDVIRIASLSHTAARLVCLRRFLRAEHLTDVADHATRWLEAYRRGLALPPCVVLYYERATGVVLSAKPSLVAAARAGKLVADIADFTPDAHVVGYIASITDYGVFVSGVNRVAGLAAKVLLRRRWRVTATLNTNGHGYNARIVRQGGARVLWFALCVCVCCPRRYCCTRARALARSTCTVAIDGYV